jgi:hypothetical protein
MTISTDIDVTGTCRNSSQPLTAQVLVMNGGRLAGIVHVIVLSVDSPDLRSTSTQHSSDARQQVSFPVSVTAVGAEDSHIFDIPLDCAQLHAIGIGAERAGPQLADLVNSHALHLYIFAIYGDVESQDHVPTPVSHLSYIDRPLVGG